MSKCLSWHCFLFAELLISAKLVYLLKCCCSYNSKEALIRLVRESLLSCHSQKWMFWPFCESVHWNTIAIYFCPFHSSLGVKALISIYSRSGLVSTNSRGEYVTRTGKTFFRFNVSFRNETWLPSSPSASKPCCHYAILSATRQHLPGKWKLTGNPVRLAALHMLHVSIIDWMTE